MINMEFDQKLRSMETDALTNIALSRENLQLFTAKLKDAATSTGNMAFVRSLSWQSGRKSWN